MANCVNINTKEFKELQKETGLSKIVLQSKVSVWQDVNGLEKFPNKEQIFSFTPMSKRLGIYKKKLSFLQTNIVKKKIGQYNKNNSTNISVIFEQQGEGDVYTWDIVNEGIPVTKQIPGKVQTAKRGAVSVDSNLQERLFESNTEINTSTFLNTIANSKHPLSDLAKTLTSLTQELDIPIELVDAEVLDAEGVPAIAYYDHGNKKITVADKALYPKGQAESTILHEILHALSWEKLSVANADIIKDFETIYNHAKENSSLADTHAYTSKDEFFVALFTNSNFIKDLKNIPATDIKVYPNLFTELLDKLLNLLGVTSETTAYEQAFSIASNILKEEVTPNPESITEDAPITGEEILNFFEQMDLADLLESPQQNQLIDGKTTEEFLAEGFTPEENQEIEKLQEEVSEVYSRTEEYVQYSKELDRVQQEGAVLATTEFGGAVTVSFTSVEQAVQYFETKLEELQQEILEEGELAIANTGTPIGITQPNYDAYLKQKEAMLVHVENSLKNLYAQKNRFKSAKFDAKISEFRTLKDNLFSDIFDYNKPEADKLALVKSFFNKDVETVSILLSNPTIDNYFLAKDLLSFMQKISDPTKEGNIQKGIGNTMSPYLGPQASYPPEVLEMLKDVRAQIDKAQMLLKNAGEEVLMELLERHESKLKSVFNVETLDEVREELKKDLQDISAVESYLFATGDNIISENNILDSLLKLEYEVEESKQMAIQTAIKTEITVAEKAGIAALEAIGEDYSLFVKPGKNTDKLIEKFTRGYSDFLRAIRVNLDTKIYEAIKNKDRVTEQQLLTQKFHVLNNDTEFIDVGLLHELENGTGKYSKYKLGTPAEAEAYKISLIQKIGQIEYDKILETQRNSIDSFQQDLNNYVQYKLDQEGVLEYKDLSPEGQRNIIIFEARSNPLKFTENYKLTGTNMVAYSIGNQANSMPAKLTYNTYIPKKTDLQGADTNYFDADFDKIANNADILALYTAIRKGVYQIEDFLRGSGTFVSAGDLPSFKETMTDIILDKGWLGAIKQGLPTSLPAVLKVLKEGITLKPIRTFLGKELSGKSVRYSDDNIIERPTDVSFDNKGKNKTDLALVVKAALEFSAVHKARALSKDKVRLYMEESMNIKDSLGRVRTNEIERQKFFYDQILLNKKGKEQFGAISERLIAWDRKMSKKRFSKARMYYKFFTEEQKDTYRTALIRWNNLEKIDVSNLSDDQLEKHIEDKASLENTMELMGNDYFLSTIYTAIALKLAISINLISNPVAQIFNKVNGWSACFNRDGRYWPKGSFYACNSFLHKKPMMRLVDDGWDEQAKILRIFTDRLGLISDGTSELERAEGKLKKKLSVLYPMGLMKWAEDSNQTLGILCMATGFKIKDINGNEVPLFTGKKFNGYTIEKGNLALSPEFDTAENRELLLNMTADSMLEWKGDTKETLNELNGDYSHTGVTRIKGNVLTAPLMAYKTWLPKFLATRWKREQKNIKKGVKEKGFMWEALTGKSTGASGILLGSTVALGAFSVAFPAIPLTIGGILVGAGIVKNIVNSNTKLVQDEDEIVITWQKQTAFVLQTLLRTPATPLNIIAGRELIEGSEKYLGLSESKLNEKASLLAARDVARNLQYSLMIVTFSLAIQAAFGPPDEEKEKKGEEGSAQRKRWLAQQEKLREEHPYFNFAANALERMLQETNTCLDPTILATTFGSKNTLEGSYDKLGKALQAWLMPEEEDIIKTGKNKGQTKSSQFLRASILPSTLRQIGAEGGFKDPLKGWRAGFETITEKERLDKFWAKSLLRTTDYKVASAKYKAEIAIKTPIATERILEKWGYTSEAEIPIVSLDNFKKRVKIETKRLIKEEGKVPFPRRSAFNKEQKKKE